MSETDEARIKRMQMRSWRRGTKEMDLILGPYSDSELARLSEAELTLYDQVLEENDHDLYLWISGKFAPPAGLSAMLEKIAEFAKTR